jgi:hypothetical protein
MAIGVCALNERTAQRYMEIAKGETTLRAKVTSDTMSELTLKKAKQLIKAGEEGSWTDTNSGPAPGDNYEAAETKLIKKLEKIISPETAEAAAQKTINQIVGMVEADSSGQRIIE